MSERSIQIDGVTYLRSRDAARIVDLAPDYLSRLARSGDIDGRRVENLWFVNLNSIKGFLADQQRQKERWYAELAC
jgi:hypothetical protein